jgi:tripartite-type tricarboxylate transporter receptor subunit TctC
MNHALQVLALLFAIAAASVHAADPWPSRTITLVAPGAAGGTSDIFARLLADGLSRELGRTVIVENRDGAGTLIGSKAVAGAKPDGHTLLIGAAAITISPHVMKGMALDPTRDLQAVRLLARFPNVMIVNAASPVASVPELLHQVRANPGRYNFSSGGVGISEHLSGELFMTMTGTHMVHVPFKGSTASAMAVVTGDALVSFGNMAAVMPQVKAGKLRAIAVTGSARSFNLPDVPTVAEAGVPGYEVSTWFGLLAPAGTPAEVIRTLDVATQKFLARPETRERLAGMGAEGVDEGPAAFAERVRADYAKWGEVVRNANIRID